MSRLHCAAAAAAAAAICAAAPLRFRPDGTFKIVEVSDTHFTHNTRCNDLSPAQQQWPCSDANATAFWRTLIVDEAPDVFLFTGDNVCGGDASGGAHAIEGLLADWADGGANAHVPWVAVEGNHDGESGLNYAAVAAKLLSMPNGLNEPNPGWLGSPLYGNTNFVISVGGPAGAGPHANASLLALYFIDSNSYSTNPLSGGGYGWVHQDQLAWFANQSAAIKAAAATGGYAAPAALAFQHIPTVQHRAWATSGGAIVGQYHEAVCSPDVDSGEMLTLMEAGDVKALTVGHDHTNDFCTATPVQGVTLCYDGHGSYGASGYGEADWPIRARVWHVSHFGAFIQTYKRLDTLAGGAFPPGNASVIDLQTVFSGGLPLAGASSSQTGGNPSCPAGYTVIDVDLNRGAGGSYSYLCILRAAGAGVDGPILLNLSVAIGTATAPPVCPPGEGWQQVPGNLKEGTQSTQVQNLCVLVAVPTTGSLVITDATVVQQAASCPASANVDVTGDISGGVGVEERVCAKFEAWSPDVAARVRSPAGPLPRLPAHSEFAWSADRPVDKAPRAAPPPRRSKPAAEATVLLVA